MHWALQSIKRGNRAGLQAGLVLTFLMGLAFLLTQMLEYARIGFAPSDGAFAIDLLRPHRPARSARLRRADAAGGRDDPLLPRPLHAGAPPRRRDPRDLLALRRRNVDRGVHDRSTSSEEPWREPVPERGRGLPLPHPHGRLLRADRRRGRDRDVARGSSSSSADRRGRRSLGCARGATSRALRPAVPAHAAPRTSGASSSSRTRPSAATSCCAILRDRAAGVRRGGARRLPGAELAAPALGLRRGRRARGGAGAARREPRAAARARRRRAAARSATASRCRRSRTRSAPSAPTRSSSRRIPRAARTGSSGTSSARRASASPSRSRTSSSTSRPTRPSSSLARLLAGARRRTRRPPRSAPASTCP